MSESGCSRDVACQNLEVAGLAKLDTFCGKLRVDNSTLNNTAGTTITLTREQSGTLFTVDGTNNNVVTLPAVNVNNVGCVYEFLVTVAVGGGTTTQFVLPGANVSTFYATIIRTAAGVTADNAGDTLTLVSGSAIGSRVRLTVVTDDGTNSVVMAEVHSDQLATVA